MGQDLKKAAPGVVGRCETIDAVAELTGLIPGHVGHRMAADDMGDIYCYICDAWLSDAESDAQDEADGVEW